MKTFKLVLRHLINILIFLIFFFPFFWMLTSSLKTLGEVLQFPPSLFPKEFQWGNFSQAVGSMNFLHYLKNSVIITGTTLVLQMLTVVLAAYGFARYSFKGKSILFGLVMLTMMVPGQLIFLPIFVLFSDWGLINSYTSLILPFITSAFGIFMLRQTFKSIPKELIEAARLDNASELTIVRKIMLPIARPTLATLALLTFIGTWNEYFWPLTLTTNDSVRTLPVGVASMINQEAGTNYHILMAGNVLLVIPILIIYFLAQRHIIKAFTYIGDK